MRKTFTFCIIIILLSLNLISFELKFLKEINLDKQLTLKSSVAYKDSLFFIKEIYNQQIIMFNDKGDILKRIGGKGKGPGEFQFILSYNLFQDKIIVNDLKLYRGSLISIYGDEIETFPVRHRYAYELFGFGDKLLFIGRFPKNPFDPIEKLNILNIYEKRNDRYSYKISSIPIEKLLKNFKSSYYINKFSHMESWVPIAHYSATINENFLYILYSYLPYFIKYNVKNSKVEYKDLNFKGYISPYEIDLKKLMKKTENIKETKIYESRLVFSPLDFHYFEKEQLFIAHFRIPLQLRKKMNQKKKYRIVIFNNQLESLASIDTNIKLVCLFYRNNKINLLFRDYPSDTISIHASELENTFFLYELNNNKKLTEIEFTAPR